MTPDFPHWAGAFNQELRRLCTPSTLHQFERLFRTWVPPWRLAQEDDGPHSRERCWSLRLVFWTFLWQVAQSGASCREAIRQAQALCQVNGRRPPPDTTSPYCQARAALPIERLDQIGEALIREADQGVRERDLWCGHRVLTVDGTCVTAPDTELNQSSFPQQSVQAPGCGFPLIRIVALLSLTTGMITAWVKGHYRQHEVSLFASLWEHLRPNDVLLGDRGFCFWGLLAQCQRRQVHAVFRVKGPRRGDFRRGKKISDDERLVQWRRPSHRALTIPAQEWALLPSVLTVRVVRSRLLRPGFRTCTVFLATTLLDSEKYSSAAVGQLYFRRWAMELSLRNLKTTLQMDQLSCKTPENLERELRMHFLVHNLVRRLMLEAARLHSAPLQGISFAGSLSTARRYAEALLQARTKKCRQSLLVELFRVLAADLVPQRPGRREPRALKRRNKPFPFLTSHRKSFREIPHKSRCRAPKKSQNLPKLSKA